MVKNTSIIAIGNFLPKLTNIFTLPIITSGLTTAEYGTYDLIITLVALVIPIITLKIQSAAFRFLIDCRDDKEKQDKIITNIFVFIISVILLAIVILYVVLGNIGLINKILICLYFFGDTLMITVQEIVRGLSYNKFYSLSAIIQSVINMILIIFTVTVWDMGLKGVFFALVVALFISIGWLIYKVDLLEKINVSLISFDMIKKMISYSWALVPNSISYWMLSFSDRFILTTFIGIEANAVYAVANKIPSLISLLQGTFGFAWQENASLARQDEDAVEYYAKVFDVFFCILTGMMALLIAFAPLLFDILIKGDYKNAYDQLPVLFLAMFFSTIASFMSGIYVAHKKTKSIGVTTIVAAVINIAVDLLLINKIGIYAASISTLVSYFVLATYRMIDINRKVNMNYRIVKIVISVFILVCMCMLSKKNTIISIIINGIVAILVTMFLNKDILLTIIKWIVSKKRSI